MGNELPILRGYSFRRKPVNGLDAAASLVELAKPALNASLPASVAFLKAVAIFTGSFAVAIAVFTSTASAPISIASAACEGRPSPASTTTGTVACVMIISMAARVLSPWLEPIGLARGMTVAVPTSWSFLARIGSALM